MKKIQNLYIKNSLIITFIIFTNLGFSQNANSLFVEGNKLFKQEKYNDAIDKYLAVEKQNQVSADLYFNLANTYYKLNKVAPSIYYFEKALQLEPNNKDIKNNLALAKKMTLDNIEAIPKNLSQKISKNTIQQFSYNSWAYISVGFSFLFAILFLLYHFSVETAKKRFLFVSSIISGILVLLTVMFAFQSFKIAKKENPAIIFAQQTSVKDAPTLSAENIFDLHEGTKVQILESKNNWKKIKIADGQTGWIIANELKKL